MTDPVHLALEEARRHGCLVCGSRGIEPGLGPYTGTLVCRECNAVHQLSGTSFVVRGSPHLVLTLGAPPRRALQVSVERPARTELAPYRTDPVALPERVVVKWRGYESLLLRLILIGFACFAFTDAMVSELGLGLLGWILAGLGTVVCLAKVPMISRRTLVVQGGRAELGVTRTSLLSALGSSREIAMSRSQHAFASLRPEQVVLVRHRASQQANPDSYAVLVLDDLGRQLDIETTPAVDDARFVFRVLLGFVPSSENSAPRALPERPL